MERSITLIGALLAKAESQYNTDPTPAAADDAIPVVRGQVTLTFESEAVARQILDGGHTRLAGDNSLPRVKISFSTELAGNGTVQDGATDIRLNKLLLPCDFARTATAETTGGAGDGYITYKPTVPTDQGASVTIYFYSHLKLHKITGCKGNVSFGLAAGQYGIANWEFYGNYNAIADATFPTGMVYSTSKPAIFQASSITWASYTPILSKINLNLGNSIQRRDDATATLGVKGFIIGDRASSGDFDPEAVAEATNPFWADWRAATTKTFTVPLGSAAGNKFTFTVVALPRSLDYGDRNQMLIHNVKFDIVKAAITDTNGNEFQIKVF